MKARAHLLRSAVGLAAIAMLAGCGASPASPVFSGPATSAVVSDEPVAAQASMVTRYLDAEQLAGDATLLIVGRVTGTTSVRISELLFTRYTIDVESALAGAADGELAVYLVGEPGQQTSVDAPAYFHDGQRYVLFLRPTDLPAGEPGGDGYYVVGPGAWGETSASGFTIWVDPARGIDLARIPAAFSLPDAAEALAADRVGSAG